MDNFLNSISEQLEGFSTEGLENLALSYEIKDVYNKSRKALIDEIMDRLYKNFLEENDILIY